MSDILVSELQTALKRAKRAIGRGSIQVLQGVRLTHEQIESTNMSACVRVPFETGLSADDDVIVPMSTLCKTLTAIGAKSRVTLKVANGALVICSDAGDTSVPLYDRNDWPTLPESSRADATIAPAGLLEAIGRVAKFVSVDESRPILTAVHMACEDEGIFISATDSYHLGVERVDGNGAPSASFSPEYLEAMDSIEMLHVSEDSRSSKWIHFDSVACNVSVRLTEGQFPDWRRLLPENYELSGAIGETLVKSLKLATKTVCTGNAPVKLTFNGECNLSARMQDGPSHASTHEFTGNGEEMTIGANPDFLLNCIDFAGLDFSLISPLRPIAIGVGTDRQALCMPVRLPD